MAPRLIWGNVASHINQRSFSGVPLGTLFVSPQNGVRLSCCGDIYKSITDQGIMHRQVLNVGIGGYRDKGQP